MNGCKPLAGRHILVVEDEYLIAEELCAAIGEAGGSILGPVGDVHAAMALVAGAGTIDCAVLDINLSGTLVFPLADMLADRAVPFVFTTGYDQGVIPERHAHIIHCEKPVQTADVVNALAGKPPHRSAVFVG